MTQKQRLTVTVDPALVAAGHQAVQAGQASSLSAWVNEALASRAARDGRLQALAAAVADFEQEHGQITAEEIETQRRADRTGAVVIRSSAPDPTRQRGRSGAA